MNPKLQTAGTVISFGIRHAAAIAITTLAPCILWTITYLALLIYAMITNEGIGGPLAYPAGLLMIGGLSLFACLFILFPMTAICELLFLRKQWSILLQIPFLTGMAIIVSCVLSILAAINGDNVMEAFWVFLAIIGIPLLILLGIYWWTAQSIPLLKRLVSFVRQRLSGKGHEITKSRSL